MAKGASSDATRLDEIETLITSHTQDIKEAEKTFLNTRSWYEYSKQRFFSKTCLMLIATTALIVTGIVSTCFVCTTAVPAIWAIANAWKAGSISLAAYNAAQSSALCTFFTYSFIGGAGILSGAATSIAGLLLPKKEFAQKDVHFLEEVIEELRDATEIKKAFKAIEDLPKVLLATTAISSNLFVLQDPIPAQEKKSSYLKSICDKIIKAIFKPKQPELQQLIN